MNVETVSLIITTLISGVLVAAALLRNYRSRSSWLFAIFVGLLFIHDTMCILENFKGSSFVSVRLHAFVVLLVGPAAWLFFRRVAKDRSRLPRLIWIYPLLILLSVIFTTPSTRHYEGWVLVLSHVAFIFAAVGVVLLLKRAQERATLTREKLKLKYVFWGAVFTIAFFVTDALYFSGFDVVPLGTFARLIFIFFVFQTFIQKQLMTAQEVFGKLVLFGGIALVLSAIYLLLVSWVGDRTGLFFFNTFIASSAIIILFDPIQKFTHRFTRRLLVYKNSQYEEVIDKLVSELRGVVEPIEIESTLQQAFKKIGLTQVALYFGAGDDLSFEKATRGEGAVEISVSDPILEYMQLRQGRPFILESVENDRDSFSSAPSQKFFKESADSLRRLEADFVLPFMYQSSVIGFASAQVVEGNVISHEQLRLFIPLAKQIALQLNSAQTFTKLRNRDKLAAAGEMAAGLAHEIKNPLGAIKGAAQLLNEGSVQSEKEFLDVIIQESDRLSEVLSDFLEYAKPRRKVRAELCDPQKVVDHTISLVGQQTSVSIQCVERVSDCLLDVDPELLKQIILNLLLNAVDAVEGLDREPQIVVGLKEAARKPWSLWASGLQKGLFGGELGRLNGTGHSHLEMSVSDNGVGIPPEALEKMFVPFYTTKPKGTGLGLAICHRLAEGMGGSISVRAQKPYGTRFSLHLPVTGKSEYVGKHQQAHGWEKRI